MIAAPYLTLAVWSLAAAVVRIPALSYSSPIDQLFILQLAIRNPEKVNRDRRFFYCSLDYSPL
jgi:hypothetical protein